MDLATRGRTAADRSALMGARTTRRLRQSLSLQTRPRRVLIGCGRRDTGSGTPCEAGYLSPPKKNFLQARKVKLRRDLRMRVLRADLL